MIADITGDRTPDILWTDGSSISVLPGRGRLPASLDTDGEGIPDECRSTAVDVNQFPVFLLSARLDGDALPDLIIGSRGELRVFRNAGAGRFERGAALAVLENPRAAAAGDLDGDGDTDLVFGATRETPCPTTGKCEVQFAVAFNAGDGTWERVERYPAGFGGLALSLSDLDRDGDLDVIAAIELKDQASQSAIAVFRNGQPSGFMSPKSSRSRMWPPSSGFRQPGRASSFSPVPRPLIRSWTSTLPVTSAPRCFGGTSGPSEHQSQARDLSDEEEASKRQAAEAWGEAGVRDRAGQGE